MTVTTELPQHERALLYANQVRTARARIRNEIYMLPRREGLGAVAEIIRDPGDLWAGAKLHYLLTAPARCGKKFSLRVRGEIRPDKPLGELTDRQRSLLCERMGVRA